MFPLDSESLRHIGGSFIYALRDNQGIFYIGSTRNARRRFWRYADRCKNALVRRRLSSSGSDVRVVILRSNPDDLSLAEEQEIINHRSTILNVNLNPLTRCRVCGVEIGYRLRKTRLCGKCAGVDHSSDFWRHAS